MKNKRVLAGLLIALVQACASGPVPPELPGEEAARTETSSPAPPAPQPAPPAAGLPDASRLPPFEGGQKVIREPLRGLRAEGGGKHARKKNSQWTGDRLACSPPGYFLFAIRRLVGRSCSRKHGPV